MHIAAMAEEVKTVPDEPGAPFPRDHIDPELVKLSRPRPKVGIVTAAGVVFLCVFSLLRLAPDRRFGGEPEAPTRVALADIMRGAIADDAHVVVDAAPLMSHAIRSATAKNSIGMRVVPARGSNSKLWLVLPGDGWAEPNITGYAGRLRPLHDLPIADSIADFLAANPRPLFATTAAVRAGFASNQVTSVSGDTLALRDTDRVGFDVVDPGAATVVCTFNERHGDVTACRETLAGANVAFTGTPEVGRSEARFSVAAPDAVATTRETLEKAQQWGMRVEPVTRHHETTWGALRASSPTAFTAGDVTIPDAQLDLIGLYVVRTIPSDAFALIVGEHPQDYWYVLPITIVVALIALLFAWALVRAIKRDLLPPRA